MKITKTGIAVKAMDDEGRGLARIALLSEIDHDGDTYEPGAFASQGEQHAQILAAHNWQSVPLGKARIYEDGNEALAELHLNLDTSAGKEWHSALKFDMEHARPVQEWSYGFRVLDSVVEQRDGKRIRVLKKLKVFEVSPVVQGAGVGTGTLLMKGAEMKEDHFGRMAGDLSDTLAAVRSDPKALSAAGLKQLADLHAGIGAIIEEAGAEEAAARRLVAGQAYRETSKRLAGRQ
ncbi:MAG: HK97 family phage prohead protease [Pseudomonadota bacterium]|nr:HK97 family phage prohead protease [Pseudomonadota bacterium]